MGSYEPTVYPDGAPAALQLISYDSDTGLVECGQEALACLRSIKTPVGVIAVTGRARTGKSYILNQLLGQSTGFRLAHSHRPCTKGLWIWSQPFKRVGPDGNPYHLVSLAVQQADCQQLVAVCAAAQPMSPSCAQHSSARCGGAAAVNSNRVQHQTECVHAVTCM